MCFTHTKIPKYFRGFYLTRNWYACDNIGVEEINMETNYLLQILLEKMERMEKENKLLRIQIEDLREKVFEIERKNTNMKSIVLKENSIKGRTEYLINYLEKNMPENEKCRLSYMQLLVVMQLSDEITIDEFNRSYSRCISYLNRNSDFFCTNLDENENIVEGEKICFSRKTSKNKKISINEICEFITNKIANSDTEFIDINAYKIQFEIGIKDRVQMVGKAMMKVYDVLKGDRIVEQPKKEGVYTSKFTITYKKR